MFEEDRCEEKQISHKKPSQRNVETTPEWQESLQKTLYGLKQAGRQWYKKLNEKLLELNLTPTNADPCVYNLKQGGEPLLILIYVDDILKFYHNKKDINVIRKGLLQEFEVRDLGAARYCLGIEITRSGDQIAISQSNYIQKLLSRFRMEDCNPVSTPVESVVKLEKDADEAKLPGGTRPLSRTYRSFELLSSCHKTGYITYR